MFYLGFFFGWVIGILTALLLLYLIRRESEQVADGERVCSNKENSVRWDDIFYVEVATGKYHLASDLVKEYGRPKFAELVAYGKYVNEGRWEKMQEGKE